MITRVEVIDHRVGGEGRLLVMHDVQAEISMQDNGRTLKVFVTEPAVATSEDHAP